MNAGGLKKLIGSLKAYAELERYTSSDMAVLPRPGRNKANVLADLKAKILESECCQLCRTRKKLVFGSGSPDAALMFVGEAPGADEDIQGEPFVGRAGQLLTKIIEYMGIRRQDVYICNILKCRPPDNRQPYPTEILACEEYLAMQIDIIRPRVICALGKFAAQTLLRDQTPITQLRGRQFDYKGIKLIPTFHPAYLLRNPQEERFVLEDMRKVKKVLEAR